MKMKRTIMLGMAAILALGAVLTGCGTDGRNSGKAENDANLIWYAQGDTQQDLNVVMEAASKITKEKIGVGIQMYQVPNSEYSQKLQTMINAGEEIDICFANPTTLSFVDNARKGAFVQLDDMLTREGKDMYNLIDHRVFDQARIDGKLYGIPTNKEIAWQNVWLVNVPIAQKYGIDYKKQITSLEEIEPILQKIKDGEGEGFNVLMPWSGGMIGVLPFENIGNTVFGIKFDPDHPEAFDGKIYNLYETEEAKAHLKTMNDYYNKGFLSHDVNASTTEMQRTGKWFLNLQGYQPDYEIADSAVKGYQVDIVSRHRPVMSGTMGVMNVIPVTSKRPEKAMELLNLVNSDEKLRTMMSYGIEGVHYNLNNEGKRITTERGKTAYGSMQIAGLGNMFITGLSENDSVDKWKHFEQYNNSAVESPLLGFLFNGNNLKSEIAGMDSVVSQYKKDLLFGRVDPEEVLPTFISKLKAAGADKVQQEIQRQFDEFRSAKK